MDRRIIELYDEYTHAPLQRRDFLDRLAKLAGGSAAAYALLPLLENNYAKAQIIAPDDPGLKATRISYPGAGGDVAGYFVAPAGGKPAPAVIVIHENRGLNAHIEDVTRRVAKAGFVALAPDLLSSLGGTPKDEDKAREMIAQLKPPQAVGDLQAAVSWLAGDAAVAGKIGCVGFCWGGGMSNRLAVAEPRLGAAVVYYGPSPALEDVPKIKAPLLLHYAGLDKRINDGVPPYIETLEMHDKPFEKHVYDGVDHAFNNDAAAARYNAAAAQLAWDRTIAFLTARLAR
jgi:carboxymethylenebutenolidase